MQPSKIVQSGINSISDRFSATLHSIRASHRPQEIRITGQIYGLFHETGIEEMHNVSEHEVIEIVLPFLRAFVDEVCSTNGGSNITKVVTIYVDMVDSMYRNYLDPG